MLTGASEGKEPNGRPMCIWQNNIKMDLQEIGQEVVDWIAPVRGQLAACCVQGTEPMG